MKKDKYLEKLLNIKNEHQKEMNRIVVGALKEEAALVQKLQQEDIVSETSIGEKISDKIASFGGSWPFIFIFFLFLFLWMFFNINNKDNAYDPYPFILLNLILSCLAAIQAPIILMSQNRKEKRDRSRAQDDYLIDLKAELENRITNQKLDLLINEQIKQLIEIQEIQITKINQIASLVKKNSPGKSTKAKNISS